jgi:hypothetical protein
MSVKKIIQRRGDFTELPILSEGEIGYATDSRRMFIGNKPTSLTGWPDASFIYDFDLPLHIMEDNLYSIFVNDQQQQNITDYTIISSGGVHFTSTLATSDTVVLKYNTEIPIKETATSNDPHTVELDGNIATPTIVTPISISSNYRNSFNLTYTMRGLDGFRKGVLSICIDGTHVILDDSFSVHTHNNSMSHAFSGEINNDTFRLLYMTTDLTAVNFSYIISDDFFTESAGYL